MGLDMKIIRVNDEAEEVTQVISWRNCWAIHEWCVNDLPIGAGEDGESLSVGDEPIPVEKIRSLVALCREVRDLTQADVGTPAERYCRNDEESRAARLNKLRMEAVERARLTPALLSRLTQFLIGNRERPVISLFYLDHTIRHLTPLLDEEETGTLVYSWSY